MITLPWWLNPWREVGRMRGVADANVAGASREIVRLNQELDMIRETGRHHLATITNLESDLAIAQRQIRGLRGQLADSVTGAKVSGSALSDVTPEFIIAGLQRPDGSKRIQVSRDIEVSAFAMTEPGEGAPRFKIGAIMGRLLMIDKGSYADCLAHLATIWSSQDREQPKPIYGPPYEKTTRLTPVNGPLQLPTGES